MFVEKAANFRFFPVSFTLQVDTPGTAGRLDKETILANAAKSESDKNSDASNVPDAFIDPVTLAIMEEPAIVPSGYSFDLMTIEQTQTFMQIQSESCEARLKLAMLLS